VKAESPGGLHPPILRDSLCKMPTLEHNNKTITLDVDGFLIDPNDWNESVAQLLSVKENIELHDFHLVVIHTLREYYLTYQKMPRMRELMELLRTKPGMKTVNSALLHQWFPLSVTLQTARLAGLPKPKRCM